MKHYKFKISSICIAVILFLFYFAIFSNGEFRMVSSTALIEEAFAINENYYFGYEMVWSGVFKPTIRDISFRKQDGTLFSEKDEHLMINALIDTLGHTGMVYGESYEELVRVKGINYVEAKNFKVDDQKFTLVLKAIKKSENYQDNFSELIIDYNYLGLRKKAVFEFNGFTSRN
ncbi:hypothetical protein [Alkaliphilus transvaalensis]|uniref:hypothetical protein n=1 Tax=Alkaliphilus transvaalensis TaxID=114628 RepID=UPI0004787B5D|nr:hypothetical protein [Alkaliphilus transvaalensis]